MTAKDFTKGKLVKVTEESRLSDEPNEWVGVFKGIVSRDYGDAYVISDKNREVPVDSNDHTVEEHSVI